MAGNFCRDDVWNLNETWNVDVPDFTTCFQDTVFVFAPCLVFSLLSILDLCLLSRHIPHQSLPWTWRIILKLILGVLLFIISVAWCSLFVYKLIKDGDVPISTVAAAFARSFTHLIIIALMLKHRNHGITTSTILAMVWLCFAMFGAVMHRSAILKYSEGSPPDINFILCMIYYPVIYIQLILSFFADVKSYSHLEYGSPLEEEAFISSIFYLWFNRIVYIGYKRLLTVKDFLPLALKLKSSYVYEKLSTYWKFHLTTSEFQKKSLVWAVMKSFWPWFIAGSILDVLFIFISLVPPLILNGILKFVENDHYAWRSYFYCAAIFIICFVCKTVNNNAVMYLLTVILQVKSSLISAIFRKNLLISSVARKDFTSGSITNLISVDVKRISDFALYAPLLISAPLRIIMILYMMWQYIGPSCLAGAAVIVILLPISFYMSRVSEKFTEKQMELKDRRLKVMNEILQGIKILKFYAWEVPFSLKVSKTRKEEIRFIRFSQMCYVVTSFVFECAPILVSIASFTTYVLIDSKNVLDPVTAFVSLNLLSQLRFSLFLIPDTLSELIQTITSFGRIRAFLSAEETDTSVIGNNADEGDAITFRKASLHWSKESSFMLENIDFNVGFGKLIAVIGPVGSGKSSLLSSVLGEMRQSSGSVDVKGTLAYVPQEAWILNRTLKNNILLERPSNEAVYNKILDCCCLRPDLEVLPGGDLTEIGEKGINLSGGQKQRISLARSVFQNRDIYLLDDPLSAVDAHVRKALFDDVIGNKGLLKNKTRILVTHDISVLPSVDLIIRMDEGKILESGTYQELMDGNGSFLNFIQTHSGLTNTQESDLGNNVDLIYLMEEVKIFESNTYQQLMEGDGNFLNFVRTHSVLTNELGIDSENKKETSAANNSEYQKVYERTISEDILKTSELKQQNDATALIEDEKMEEGGVKRGIYLNYMRHVGWPIIFLSLLGFIAFNVFEAWANIWVADWSSDPVTNGTDNSRAVWRISVYGGLGAAQAFTIIFGVACLIYGSTRAAELYHNQMFDSILKSPVSFFDTTPMGRIINRFSTDMDTIDINIVYSIEGVIDCLLYTLSTFIVIGINTPIFLASIVPLGVVYYTFLKLHLNTSRQIMRLQSTTRSPIYSHMLESINGASSIKAFQLEKEFIDKLEENVDNHIACSFNTSACNRWLHFWLDFIGSIVVLVAAILAIDSREKLGASFVGLVITYALSVTDALMWIIRSNTELENKSVSIERIDEYCHLTPEAPWRKPDNDPVETWPESGEIVFDNYSTRYRENLDLVLKDVNINIHSDEKVGIVGRTGAGKSSVTLSLFRIIEPANGTILIDNIDISQIGLHTLRSKLTIIPQDPVLFTGTLRFNLDPNDEYDDSSIWNSLENSHLKEFVSSLADGLQHSIDEGGQNLSAGQKQLLCLSRALLKKSKILILDEATAAVDMDTDSLVQDTIKTAFAKHTVITIAHRLNTIMDYDKIIVMDSGSVAEVGSPAELLQNKSSYFYDMSRKAGLI